MESKERKSVNFIAELNANLKASNIATNITSLQDYSTQIELLLGQINIDDNNQVAQSNLKFCKDAVKATLTTETIELLNEYIKLGDFFKFLIPNIKDDSINLKYGKQIAIHYLDIAKLTKDEKIKNIAFAIADELSQ
jgi:hypothetical protein